MSKNTILEKLAKSIIKYDKKAALAAAEEAVSAGIDPLEAIEKGLSVGIKEVGDRFGRAEFPLPYLMASADAMTAAMDLLIKKIPKERTPKPLGKVVIGTVQGDIHDIGKNIVKTLMNANGFLVYDAGVDVSVEKFIDEAEKVGADIIGASAFLTTTRVQQKRLLDALGERGIRDKYKVMIGGGMATQSFCDEIKADAYGANATEAVEKARRLQNI